MHPETRKDCTCKLSKVVETMQNNRVVENLKVRHLKKLNSTLCTNLSMKPAIST